MKQHIITTANPIALTELDPTAVFLAIQRGYRAHGCEKLYIKRVQTYREDGTLRKMSEWGSVLMSHKKWQRTDEPVKSVRCEALTTATGAIYYRVIFE